MTRSNVEFWVENLIGAREQAARFVPTKNPTSLQEAYEIQEGVAQRFGPIGAFKTARKEDAPPIMAPIFAADIFRSGADIRVSELLGIELEVGFKIVDNLPTNLDSTAPSELISLIRPVVVIELVDMRFEGPLADDALAKLADNQINAGLIVGEAADDWAGDDFGTVDARMRAGSEQLLDGTATVPGGSALKTFVALASQIGTHCGGLQRGQIVITGSLHPLTFYSKGTAVVGQIAGIGSVQVNLV